MPKERFGHGELASREVDRLADDRARRVQVEL
jgi:hypothetical protein